MNEPLILRTTFRRTPRRKRSVFLFALGPLVAALAQAKVPPGTGITASTTAAGHLTSTFSWTIAKSANPADQSVAVGEGATVHWTITTSKSASGTLGGYLDGQVCVTNTGSRPTEGLAIQNQLTVPSSTTVLSMVTVDVSAKPQLNAGESYCYPYTIRVPAASVVPGATYKNTAQVTITNDSCCPGTPTGPSPKATAAFPTTPTPIDSSIAVTDTNGKSLVFGSGGSQMYDESLTCSSTPSTDILVNTATIGSTGQMASAQATVHCHVYPQSNALARPLDQELNAFAHATNCVTFYLDTDQSQSCDFPCIAESEDHHQGLARTQELSDGSIYWFLSHSGVDDPGDRGSLMQFQYIGMVDNEHVTGSGVTALRTQLLRLEDEIHPSDISFLPDIDHYDSGYLFVTKEFGLGKDCENCGTNDCPNLPTANCDACTSHKITVYYWEPGSDFQSIADIDTGLLKPSHVLIDRVDHDYYLIVLDNTCKIGQPYKAHYTDLFPSGTKGSMNVAAFQPLHTFTFNGDLGSQAKLIRDSNNTWHVLVYTSTPDTGTGTASGDDYIYVRDINFNRDPICLTDGPLGPPPPMGATGLFAHIILPAGETGFTNTGTHYVDKNGRLIVSSSERWSHDYSDPLGDQISYASRVDECVSGQ
jgi:hypothetical protein